MICRGFLKKIKNKNKIGYTEIFEPTFKIFLKSELNALITFRETLQ